jgi:hypothetical protein
MYYLQSRYYVPSWGRFLNADGYVNANGDLIGFNMYAYCSNNPVMYSDPTGESVLALMIGIGFAIGCLSGGITYYNAAKSEGLTGLALAKETVTGALRFGMVGALIGGVGYVAYAAALTFGPTSFAGVTAITNYAYTTLQIGEAATLQYRASIMSGENSWQAARNSIDAMFNNKFRVTTNLPQKGLTFSLTAASTQFSYNKFNAPGCLPLSWNTVLESPMKLGGALSYASLVLPTINLVQAFCCEDPIERAYQRGFYIQ